MCRAIFHSSTKTAKVWKMLTVWKMFSYLLTKKSLWYMFRQQVWFWYKKGHTELRHFYSEFLQWNFIARFSQLLSFIQPASYWNYNDDYMSSFPQWNPCPWGVVTGDVQLWFLNRRGKCKHTIIGKRKKDIWNKFFGFSKKANISAN